MGPPIAPRPAPRPSRPPGARVAGQPSGLAPARAALAPSPWPGAQAALSPHTSIDPVVEQVAHWCGLLASLQTVIGSRGTRALVQHCLTLCLPTRPEALPVLRLFQHAHPPDEVLAWWLAVVDGEAQVLRPVLQRVATQLLGPHCGLSWDPVAVQGLGPAAAAGVGVGVGVGGAP